MKITQDIIVKHLKALENGAESEISQLLMRNSLIRALQATPNLRIQSTSDLMCVLRDTKKAISTLEELDVSVSDIGAILYNWNRRRYGYNDENHTSELVSYITDSDFINSREFSQQEFHLVFDILYNDNYDITPYDVVASYYNKLHTMPGKKVALQHWFNCFQHLIDKLSSYNKPYVKTYILIPFLRKEFSDKTFIPDPFADRIPMDKSTIDTDVRRILLKKEDYHRSLAYVIELYKTAQEATQILKAWNESTAPLESSATILEFDDIRNVFKRWCFYSTLINRQEGLVIQGEMIRRGYINKPFKHNELELNYRRYFIEQNKSDDRIEDDEEDMPNLSHIEHGNDFTEDIKCKLGILLGMLYADPCVDKKTIARVAHFVCEGDKNISKFNKSSSTTYVYCHNIEKLTQNNQDREAYINKTLNLYGVQNMSIQKVIDIVNESRVKKGKKRGK